MHILLFRLFISFAAVFVPFTAASQLRLPRIFTDNMVLQRGSPVRFRGTGDPGHQVKVLFSGKRKQVTVESDSSWNIVFGRQKANSTPQSVFFRSGNETIELKNVLIGDLWLCIGQSNMEWPMKNELHFREALSLSRDPLLRLYNPVYAGKNIYGVPFTDSVRRLLSPGDFYHGKWEPSDSTSIRDMSAVAWYFGREIAGRERIPVGLIHLAVGGAPIESFISRQALGNARRFAPKVQGNWLFNETLPVWVRKRGLENTGSESEKTSDESGPDHAFKPGFAYEAGIAPLHSFPIKGIIWYQGESNAQEMERAAEYGNLFRLMVDDYRKKWNDPSLPVYWVQLSSIDTAGYRSQLWPFFRNEQRLLMETLKHGGMAVSSDIGSKNDVHPREKKLVGKRLARWALNKTYGRKVIPSGPLPRKARYLKDKVVITFEYAGNGLKTTGYDPPRGFSFDGKTAAKAIIRGKKVVLPVSGKPQFVYYNWQPFAAGNLVNSALLPASTFRIKVLLEGRH